MEQGLWRDVAVFQPPASDADKDPYDNGFFRVYRRVLEGAIRFRVLTIGGLGILLVAAVVGFPGIPQQFFPDSTRTQFRIDFWAPQGTPIASTSEVARRIEAQLEGDERIKSVGTFIGSGGPRFYLPVDPEFPYAEYAQIIVTAQDFESLNELTPELEVWLNDNKPSILTRVRKYVVGSGDTWPFELRISGPANADLRLAEDEETTPS